jgi:hypothetical protein
MEDNHSTANAEAEPSSVDNTSVAQFAMRRLGESQEPEVETPSTEPEPEESQETEEVVTETDESSEPEATESNPEEVLSQLDLDDMSEDELRELGQKLGSKAVARFGELTAKRKSAEEQLAKLQASIKEKENDPLRPQAEVKNNPYENIDNIEGLQVKAQEVDSVIEWAEDLLFNTDGYGPDDVITEVEGKDLTKADVRKGLLNARKNRDKFLPAQLKKLQSIEEGKQLRSAFDDRAKQELSWMDGEDNDTRQRYQSMINDTRFDQLEKLLPPDVSAQLPYLMAHAANSMYARKPVPGNNSTRLNPPSQPNSTAAQPEKVQGSRVKTMKDLTSRFQKSGKKSDFVTLRTLQLQNR